MSHQHASLAAGRWQTLPLVEQLANVGSDVARAHRWQEKDPQLCEKAFARALELLDLTIADPRWKGRRKELMRVRELCVMRCSAAKSMGATWPAWIATSTPLLSRREPAVNSLSPHYS